MKFQKRLLLIPTLTTLFATGCATPPSGTIEGGFECTVTQDGPNECKITGKVKGTFLTKIQRDLMLPIIDMVASATGFSYSAWEGLDISSFSMAITGANSFANQASVIVFDSSGSQIGQNNFPVTANGVNYRFSNPSADKSWSMQFVDIGDSVDVSLIVKESPSMSVSVKHNGSTLAFASYTRPDDGGSTTPGEDTIF